jgi:thymidine kinase
MTKALEEEMSYVESRGGIKCSVYNGRPQRELGENTYIFTIDTDIVIPDDTPLEVRVSGASVRGQLIGTQGNTVTVALQQYIGESIPQATLLSQPQLIYAKLKDRLNDKSLQDQLPLKLFARKTPRLGADFNFKIPGSAQPNQLQKETIAKALESEILFVWGPPGTGKTRTLAHCAQVFCERGQKTLILANTNIAVDNALNAVARQLEYAALDASVLRVGNPVSILHPRIQVDQTGTMILSTIGDETHKAAIVGTTLARSVLLDQLRKNFDVVTIDEASMAPLPMIFYAASLSRGKVMAVGDFRQLPPIAMNNDSESVSRWLRRDIFEEAGVISSVEKGTNDPRMIMLREQHRMDPRICQLVNEFVYDGLLEDGETVQNFPNETGFCPEPAVATLLVDTSDKHPWCSKPARSSSKINLIHASLAVVLAREASKSTSSVAIIAPYRDQAKLIRRIIKDQKLDSIQASTVHRFQGREIDTVIFDVTDSDPLPPRWFESNDSRKLVNVALSRAKRKLVIIANRQYVKNKLGGQLIDKVIEHIASAGGAVASSKFLPEGLALKDPTAPLSSVDRARLDELTLASFDEISFYPAFCADLESSKSLVEVFSPFVTRRRASFLAGYLRELIRRRIAVTLYTRSPSDQFDKEQAMESATDALQFLSKLGIRIVEISRMHEKVAFIDDNVCWHGSLNILSHVDTGESMIRLVGQSAVKQIRASLLGRPRDYQRRKTVQVTKIGDLKEGMKNVTVQGKIITMDKPHRVRTAEGQTIVANAVVADASGVIKIALWGEDAKKFKVNDEIKIENGLVSLYRGELRLSFKFGKISRT